MAIGTPGLYLVRVAARDRATGKLGMAHTIAAAPDHNPGHLTLSDATLSSVPADGDLFSQTVFTPGSELSYRLLGYGMKSEKKSGQPQLTLRFGISDLTNQRVIFLSPETAVNTRPREWRAMIAGKIALPDELTPGVYMLQFVVTDKLGKVNVERFAEFHVSPAKR